jgi:hypothetical protein
MVGLFGNLRKIKLRKEKFSQWGLFCQWLLRNITGSSRRTDEKGHCPLGAMAHENAR